MVYVFSGVSIQPKLGYLVRIGQISHYIFEIINSKLKFKVETSKLNIYPMKIIFL